jgi:histidine triad (HIT) family protein
LTIDENCIFCKIARNVAPSSKLYEDDVVMAFLDIKPLNKGHTLVISKNHFVNIFDIPQKELQMVYGTAKILANTLKTATGADGISVIQQNGKAAGQEIFHFHVHVVPRFSGQTLPSFSEIGIVERKELDEMAAKIKQFLIN